ncbi:MAG: DUF1801 domain-containing protein [Bacteroidota bacterium]
MNVQEQIENNINIQTGTKSKDMQQLHELILKVLPGSKLWFDEGKNSDGKTISNPTIGYGLRTMKYANGKTSEVFRVGMSANSTGISIYILGIKDKHYLPQSFGEKLGKATVTGYCIRFKSVKDIDLAILETAIRDGVKTAQSDEQ